MPVVLFLQHIDHSPPYLPAVEVGDKLVICLASTLNLDGTPSSASFDAVSGRRCAVWGQAAPPGRPRGSVVLVYCNAFGGSYASCG